MWWTAAPQGSRQSTTPRPRGLAVSPASLFCAGRGKGEANPAWKASRFASLSFSCLKLFVDVVVAVAVVQNTVHFWLFQTPCGIGEAGKKILLVTAQLDEDNLFGGARETRQRPCNIYYDCITLCDLK